MNTKIRLSFWICALFVITGAIILVKQQSTISELRHQAEPSPIASLQPAQTETLDPNVPPPIPANPPAMEVASAPEITRADPVSTALLQNLSNKVQALQQENERLAAELRASQPAQPEPQAIPPESAKIASAYVGPGTWVPVSIDPPERSADRIVISGNGDETMSLKLGDRPEVPFRILRFDSSTPAFRMGVAAYKLEERGSMYVVVTFQLDGLKVDVLAPSMSRRLPSFRSVAKMVRVN